MRTAVDRAPVACRSAGPPRSGRTRPDVAVERARPSTSDTRRIPEAPAATSPHVTRARTAGEPLRVLPRAAAVPDDRAGRGRATGGPGLG